MTDEPKTLKPLFSWRSAILDSDLDAVARHVALTLSLYMNERGGSAFPGTARLAEETKLHPTTVRRKLGELERGGWLVCVERGGQKGDKRRANQYAAVVPDPTLPGALGDPSPSATRSTGLGDPSPSARRPVAQGDPISPLNSPLELAENAKNGIVVGSPPTPEESRRARADLDEQTPATEEGLATLGRLKARLRPREEASG